MQAFRIVTLFATILFSLALARAYAAEPIGIWLTQKGDARIRVSHCGEALCGTVAWIKDAIDPQTGKPPVDDKNPDPAKRQRRIIGIRIFTMSADGQGGWAGSIYNSDDGQTYNGKLLLRGNQLEVYGCAGILCGGEAWRRAGR